mgnify:CR=1 FL=1
MPSFDRPAKPESAISAWIERFATLVPPGARVLDIAAGHGRHSRFFLARGCQVTAADIDTSNLSDIATRADCKVMEVDLEAGNWPFSKTRFDAIVVTNYLHRPHFPLLINNLAANGVLLYDSFAAGNERFGRPRNPDFLLQPGELLRAFVPPLQVVAYENGVEQEPRPAVRQRLCALRSDAPVPLGPSA